MRTCPFTNCGREIKEVEFACLPHWNRLTPQQKRMIHNAFDQYIACKITVDELRVIQQRILDDAQGGRRLFP